MNGIFNGLAEVGVLESHLVHARLLGLNEPKILVPECKFVIGEDILAEKRHWMFEVSRENRPFVVTEDAYDPVNHIGPYLHLAVR